MTLVKPGRKLYMHKKKKNDSDNTISATKVAKWTANLIANLTDEIIAEMMEGCYQKGLIDGKKITKRKT